MENKTAEERFCKVYTEFYGEPIDKAEQITEHRFNGNELMEFCEFYASIKLAEKDKEIERLNDEKNEALRLLNDALKLIHSLPDLLHDSLGDHTAGNDYEITSLSGERYITHKWVGSGEPLKQWIKSEIDKSLNK